MLSLGEIIIVLIPNVKNQRLTTYRPSRRGQSIVSRFLFKISNDALSVVEQLPTNYLINSGDKYFSNALYLINPHLGYKKVNGSKSSGLFDTA